ncbi:MAG TPA: hypothetical protein VLL98_01270 [Rickettsiales bacterium]|nr:hypothetical protein [Rickettsiales bacterium]
MIYTFVMLLIVLITLLFYFSERNRFSSKVESLSDDLHKEIKEKTNLEAKYKQLLTEKEEIKNNGQNKEVQIIFNKVDDTLTKVKMLDDKLTYFNTTFKTKLENINDLLNKNLKIVNIDSSSEKTVEEPFNNKEDQSGEETNKEVHNKETVDNDEELKEDKEYINKEEPTKETQEDSEDYSENVCSLVHTPLDTEKELFGEENTKKVVFGEAPNESSEEILNESSEEVSNENTNKNYDIKSSLEESNEIDYKQNPTEIQEKSNEESLNKSEKDINDISDLNTGDLNNVVESNNEEIKLNDENINSGFDIKESIEKLRSQLEEEKK